MITTLLRPLTPFVIAALFASSSSANTNEQVAKVPASVLVEGGSAVTRLITPLQYENTIDYVLGPNVAPRVQFSTFRRMSGLNALGARAAGMSAGGLEALERAARAAASTVVSEGHREFLLPCAPKSTNKPDDKCVGKVVRHYGPLLLRRSLGDDEVGRYVTIASEATTKFHDFYQGLGTSLSGLFMAPDLLYIIETTEPDPRNPGQMRLTAQSKASRLSLLMWNALPDQELIQAAEKGSLHEPVVLAQQVDRMLASPRMEDGLREFFDDFLLLEATDTLAKDAIIYPVFTQQTAKATREQTLRTIIDHVLVRNADYRDLFTTRDTFVNDRLAPIYKTQIGLSATGWSAVEVGPERAGLLSQVGFLALNAHPGRSSPTRRGRALREIFLCQKVPDPPPNVDFSGFENVDSGSRTARGRIAMHTSNPVCAGCHKVTDPIGLSLENFNGAGQFRQSEGGETIDSTGSLDGVKFSDAAGLGRALHDHPALPGCLVRRLYTYGLGFDPGNTQRPVLDDLTKRFEQHGYRIVDLLREIATDDAFYSVAAK
ncbi:MAG: DUF1592 domain-containing protein [Gammaproteobacteria bacterium]